MRYRVDYDTQPFLPPGMKRWCVYRKTSWPSRWELIGRAGNEEEARTKAEADREMHKNKPYEFTIP